MDDASDDADELGEAPTLLDRLMRHEGRGGTAATILMCVGVAGLLFASVAVASLLRQPWELDARSPTTMSVGAICGPFTGGSFVIKVDGHRGVCGGSATKCGWEGPVAVAYDPEAPARCRVAAHVDRLSPYEAMMLVIGGTFLAILIGGASYRASERLLRAAIAGERAADGVARRRLRALTWIALVAAVVLSNASALGFIAGASR